MRPESYEIQGERVLSDIARAPEDVRESFAELLEALSRNPFPGTSGAAGILPLQGFPGGWTAPFHGGDGMLAYRVSADFPVITLMDVWWV